MSYLSSSLRGIDYSLTVEPNADKVAQNTLLRLRSGPDPEFEARHYDPRVFIGLWANGYWERLGKMELPSGLSTQDYFVRHFGGAPYVPYNEERLARMARNNVPLESIRLTFIPEGMPWRGIIENVPQEAIDRVLPVAVAAETSVVSAGLGGSLPLLLAVAVGAFFLLRRK